jgi:hypothetical protein
VAHLDVSGASEADWTQLVLHQPDGEKIAVIERDEVTPGSLGEGEIHEFIESVADGKPASAARWLQRYLPRVKVVYAIQILSGADRGDGWEAVHSVQGELWGTLGGILQADLEGFTNDEGYHVLWEFNEEVEGPWSMAVLDENGRWIKFQMDLGDRSQRAAFLKGQVPLGAKMIA